MTEEQKQIMTIEEHMNIFKKQLWSNEQPMEFASQIVKELLLEVQRRRTVMAAALVEIDSHWEHHEKTATENEELVELLNLMDTLAERRLGFYAQHLSENEYKEFISRNTDLDIIANMLSGGRETLE